MKVISPMLYQAVRAAIRGALGFYFSRIERFHAERVPRTGPVIFASNHPNSLTDAFVIGGSVMRKVNFIATVQLFRFRPLRWFLSQCGVIPINRLKDDPRAMRTVKDTFEACFGALERGEAIGIFPEGITHDDPQLKTVKTGAARMALELEQRHRGRLGVKIVPVGLTFSAKEKYRSAVLAHFGEAIDVSGFLPVYAENRRDGIQQLTLEIERRIQALILHVPALERARLIEAVKRLYLERLRVGNRVIREPVSPQAAELLLTQAISKAVAHVLEHDPARAAAFARQLDRYERRLARLQLADEDLAQFAGGARWWWPSLAWSLLAVVGAPVAAYGWLHRLLPCAFIRWAVNRFAKVPADKTHVSTAALVSGFLGFGLFYTMCILACHRWYGWPASLWYGLSLPVASLLAHYYARAMRRVGASLRTTAVLLRAPLAARRLAEMRARLIGQIEAVRRELGGQLL